MKSIVPFISMLPKADIDQWLKIFKKKLPKERIIKFSSLKKSDYKKIDVAIVANPNPTEVKKLVNLKWIQSVWAGVEKLVESFKGERVKIVRLVDPEMNKPCLKLYCLGFYIFTAICIFIKFSRIKECGKRVII